VFRVFNPLLQPVILSVMDNAVEPIQQIARVDQIRQGLPDDRDSSGGGL
jgi:hypothetical protein